jgi:hypothetical protein
MGSSFEFLVNPVFLIFGVALGTLAFHFVADHHGHETSYCFILFDIVLSCWSSQNQNWRLGIRAGYGDTRHDAQIS